MSRSRSHVFGWGLVTATFLALLSASFGAGEARAGSCVAMNFTFNLGSVNTCTTTTQLDSTGAGTGLLVNDGTPGATAISGEATAATGAGKGVVGKTSSGSANSSGVWGSLLSGAPGTDSAGVFGNSFGTSMNGPGVWGRHEQFAGTAPGVLGQTNSTTANAAGLSGTINSSADYSGGVRGENFNTACCGFGVVGFHAGQGIGIGGYAPNGFGVFGWSPNNWAAYFDGAVRVVRDLYVNGTLFKGAGAFRIDNPLDPAHSYLQHSFVESPEMKNVYDGNVTTNAKGFATVLLPKWFQALNKDFRYQLTPMGERGWDARAGVWKEIAHNQFTIRTSKPNVKISWQVTGVRHDAYANANRIQVIAPKDRQAAGTYMHPQLYGQPQSKAETARPAIARKMPKLKAPASPVLPKRH
jgi:hypothetical protein